MDILGNIWDNVSTQSGTRNVWFLFRYRNVTYHIFNIPKSNTIIKGNNKRKRKENTIFKMYKIATLNPHKDTIQYK